MPGLVRCSVVVSFLLVCVRDVSLQLDGFKIFNVGHDGGYRAGRLLSCFLRLCIIAVFDVASRANFNDITWGVITTC